MFVPVPNEPSRISGQVFLVVAADKRRLLSDKLFFSRQKKIKDVSSWQIKVLIVFKIE